MRENDTESNQGRIALGLRKISIKLTTIKRTQIQIIRDAWIKK